ncbi:serine/threonine-protein kinase haspin [Sceloporus undulatus]|uniref:serine/threonine-protein kinase haspin n=1 Tax=Sceloporus undulatus TaxID=8520 RepID=UPI001C4CC24F|nr:serine/threonine-protein kinase haspin [Sceloporus undulatus]
MEQLRPRLLKTYSGLRGGKPGPGGRGRRPGLRVLPAPAPWLSPQVDPKRFFSSSSSAAGSSFEDPDFLPRKRKPAKQPPKRKPRKRKTGVKENKPPQNNGNASDSCVPPTPLCRNVTQRRQRRLLAPAPLLCSTPGPTPLTPLRDKGGDPLGKKGVTPVSGLLFGSGHWDCEDDLLPELSLLKMNWEDERSGRKDSEPCLREDSHPEPPSAPFRSRSVTLDKDSHPETPSAPFQSRSAASDKNSHPETPSAPFRSRSAASDKGLHPETPSAPFRSRSAASDKGLHPETPSASFQSRSAASDKGLHPETPSALFQSRSTASDKDSRLEASSVPFQSRFAASPEDLHPETPLALLRSHSAASDKDSWLEAHLAPFRSHSTPSDKDSHPETPAAPFRSRSAASNKGKASSKHREASSPVQGGTNSDQTSGTSPLKGVLQLQATINDDKLILSLPRDCHKPHANKRQRVGVPPTKVSASVNGSLLEEHDSIDLKDPHLQPVVLLDNQVVPSWLASKCSKKQGTGRRTQKTESTHCSFSTISGIRSNNQVVPVCGTGATGRKACISGSSSSRWGRRRKPEESKYKKHLGWKYKAETSLFRKTLRNEVDDNMASSFLSPDSSLWRRIRASFSLHKKKKILSESESANSSVGTSSSVSSHTVGSPKTPFTRTLGYSICPSSSMVLLLSTTSFSTLESTLTDAEKVYGECHQKGPISFGECIPPEKMRKCEKIGEGVFGEVFRTEGEQGPVALKIIPIEGSERVNGEPQKTFSEILPEIIISKELSLLADEKVNQTSGFIQLYSVHCVQGAYPEPLLNAWDEYHRLRTSENDRPDFFGDQQLFMVLEFEYGGTDLENMRKRQLNSAAAAKSILHQITASLAVAEESLRFEHRDLHWGNILVKRTDAKEASVRLNGETYAFPTHGILVKVIDYTFSRLERDGLTVYCDLSTDEEVFQGRGDYQFDIYRRMREENLNNWADYFPHSNILWLHYLVDKLLKEVSYKAKPTTASLKALQKQLKHFSKEVLGFASAVDLLKGSSFFQ